MGEEKEFIYGELSYQINGIVFEVFNTLGPGLSEKYYQRAIFEALKSAGFKVQRELYIPLTFKGIKIGNYYLDFLIEDKIVLEIKKGDHFRKTNINQVYEYLVATNLKLGILANFTSSEVKIKRIVNLK